MKQHFGEMNWNYDKYFKFTFVRNPWSRTVSLWAYKTGKECSFKYFLNKYVVNSIGIDYTNYYCDENGNNLVDFIGKLENFQEDINTPVTKLGYLIVSSLLKNTLTKQNTNTTQNTTMKKQGKSLLKNTQKILSISGMNLENK